VNLNAEGLDVVGTISTASEIGKVELNLIPTFVETHGHGADEGLNACGGLVVGGAEATAETLVVENLNLEGEVLLEVLDNHDEEGKLDTQSLLRVSGACDVASVDIATDEFENRGVNVLISKALDVTVTDFLFPNLERARTDGVKDRQETRLECILEHCFF
jgi:hypothetical protein